ncbi:hypothetical protein GALMADRAFT_148486 [Galerina marginata CBS 339.88]|uniref:Uncharacterized protein n=1 Tax=Galerina marginata (strain CBS 339.88) TaxID=685588 RepID=A0A067SFX6_GALM3|nr:hypothetical protein GALMADRAFT_148486 [Galerina marginata CBS 339.88]
MDVRVDPDGERAPVLAPPIGLKLRLHAQSTNSRREIFLYNHHQRLLKLSPLPSLRQEVFPKCSMLRPNTNQPTLHVGALLRRRIFISLCDYQHTSVLPSFTTHGLAPALPTRALHLVLTSPPPPPTFDCPCRSNIITAHSNALVPLDCPPLPLSIHPASHLHQRANPEGQDIGQQIDRRLPAT